VDERLPGRIEFARDGDEELAEGGTCPRHVRRLMNAPIAFATQNNSLIGRGTAGVHISPDERQTVIERNRQ
jgi:hypothetical protein